MLPFLPPLRCQPPGVAPYAANTSLRSRGASRSARRICALNEARGPFVNGPYGRQKKLASFRFRGLRKSRESCTSAISFFLSTTNPLRWALWLLNLGIPSVS